jgi:hypothetical protein
VIFEELRMETIDDIRREAGNPRHGEVGGPPRSVTRFFGGRSSLKFAAMALLLSGIILVALGVFSLVFPIAIVGFCFLAGAGIVYARDQAPPAE